MELKKLVIDGFDWDEANRAKCQNHGVSISEIEGLFKSEFLTVFFDEKHSNAEKRLIAIGKTQYKRSITL